MDRTAAHDRLVFVVQGLAAEKRNHLERLKAEKTGLQRPDFVWHYLLQSFATMLRATGWHGLIGNQENYRRVTYDALASLSPEERKSQVRQVCRAAGLRMPDRKAGHILDCFEHVRRLGGPDEAKRRLLALPGRDAKIGFLDDFPGIGPKYARNIMMDVYHEEFRDSIALDIRIKGISEALGLSFGSYEEEEAFYLGVAKDAGLNGWELDRLLFNYRPEVEARLGVGPAGQAGPGGRGAAAVGSGPGSRGANIEGKEGMHMTRGITPVPGLGAGGRPAANNEPSRSMGGGSSPGDAARLSVGEGLPEAQARVRDLLHRGKHPEHCRTFDAAPAGIRAIFVGLVAGVLDGAPSEAFANRGANMVQLRLPAGRKAVNASITKDFAGVDVGVLVEDHGKPLAHAVSRELRDLLVRGKVPGGNGDFWDHYLLTGPEHVPVAAEYILAALRFWGGAG